MSYEDTNWYERALDDEDAAKRYFSIGHGDFDEEIGFEPCFRLWAVLGGEVLVSPEYCPDEEGDFFTYYGEEVKTHAILWGRDANRSIKGRYETETHRLSVVFPNSFNKMTKQLFSKLRLALGPISSVDVFK